VFELQRCVVVTVNQAQPTEPSGTFFCWWQIRGALSIEEGKGFLGHITENLTMDNSVQRVWSMPRCL